MSEDTQIVTVSTPPADIFMYEATESAARVSWAQNEIARLCYVPSLPPKTWAGRDDVIAKLQREYEGMEESEAVRIVDMAVIGLSDTGADDDRKIAKKMMRIRLVQCRMMLLELAKNGRKETTFKGEPDEADEGKMKWVPFKEKRFGGADIGIIGRLLDVEKSIAQLDGLEGPESTDSALSIIEELDKVVEANGIKRKVTMSLAQKIKNSKISDLTDEGKRLVMSAFDEMNRERAKPVESTVIEEEEDDEDDE